MTNLERLFEHIDLHLRQGVTLDTPVTRKWDNEQRIDNDEFESKRVYAGFIDEDQGRSRQLVGEFKSPKYAKLFVLFAKHGPALVETLQYIAKKARGKNELIIDPFKWLIQIAEEAERTLTQLDQEAGI